MKTKSALRVITTLTLATTAVLGLAGCGASDDKPTSQAAQRFVVSLQKHDTASFCDLAAIGDKPVAGDKARATLCKTVLAPKIMAGMKKSAAAKPPQITVKEKGQTATATVEGFSAPLTLKKIDGRWLIAIA